LFDKFSGLPCHGLSAATQLRPVHTSLYMEELIPSIYLYGDAGQSLECGMAFLSLKKNKKWSSLQY